MDAKQEYYAVVYENEGYDALPRALFIHKDEANAYLDWLNVHVPANYAVQVRTMERQTTFQLRRGGLPQLVETNAVTLDADKRP